MSPFPHPLTIGSPTGHNVDMLYCGDDSVAAVYGLPLHCSTDDPALKKPPFAEGLAQAEYITRAVNCHDDLLKALQDLMPTFDLLERQGMKYDPVQVEAARAAIAKATQP